MNGNNNNYPSGSTERTRRLLTILHARGMSDRTSEWFSQKMFPNVSEIFPDEPVIIRRAHAFRTMLEAMTNESNSKTTGTYHIEEGELIVGTIPLGSVGLGKEFPRYMTEEEKRLSCMTSRDEESTFGHNCPDFNRVLKNGLSSLIEFSKQRMVFLENDVASPLGCNHSAKKKLSFYKAVIICCEAVIDYARNFASLAEKEASQCRDDQRKKELIKIAEICKHVPEKPARSFHEAVQSIWFTHLALHSTMNFISPGRLDQILQPYYEASLSSGDMTKDQAVELLECFYIKAASRLNMTTKYLTTQDHMDFGTGLGTNPVFLDQIASANNFLQNIVIGGVDRNGKDATNDCTHLFLKACANVGLPTPTLTVRLHDNSPQELLESISQSLSKGKNGLPIIYNDETIIPGFTSSGIPMEEARDYVVDGCWETILNAKSDWTFGMIHMLTILECAMNNGCLLTSNNPSLLRGQKKSYVTHPANELHTFDDFLDSVKQQIQFFTDKVGLGIYDFYDIDASVTPTPFFSALLGNCLEKGVDKTWGGADYIIGGVIAIAVPNAANAIANIEQIVYKDHKYSITELAEILRNNFKGYEELKQELLNLPKFGNNENRVDQLAVWLMTSFREAVEETRKLADKIFLGSPNGLSKSQLEALRNLAGHEGPSMKERFGDQFKITFTCGSGTFGQYASMGKGVAASADGREKNMPVAPNCSPSSGSVIHGIGNIFSSLEKLELNRFGAGVMLDLCIEPKENTDYLNAILSDFVKKRGSIMNISLAHYDTLKEAYLACEAVRNGEASIDKLEPYSKLSVRVGGWNAPFISFTKEQQEDYLSRHQQ